MTGDPDNIESMGSIAEFPQLQHLRILAHYLFGTSPSSEELSEHSNDYLSRRFFTSLPSGLKGLEVLIEETWTGRSFIAFIGGGGGDNDAATWRLRQQEYLPHLKTIYVVMNIQDHHAGNRSEFEVLGIKAMYSWEFDFQGKTEVPDPFLR